MARSPALSAFKPAFRSLSGFVVAELSPGCFAFVMATGIVSVAAHFRGLGLVATGLFWLNAGAYTGLWVLTLIRFARDRAQFIGDLSRHSRAAHFLTMSAGTCVLGSQFALFTPWNLVAELLWLWGGVLWIVLIYSFFVGIMACAPKPSLESGISGSWLLVIVATESVSVLGSLVARFLGSGQSVLFLSLAAYALGAMLYVFFTTLILYRWMFFPLEPEKFTPDCWIAMGALAISTLAGSLLLLETGRWDVLRRLEPVLAGSALCFWATSTWWVPLLLIMELRRHLLRGVSWSHGLDYWSLVFPLGMYAVATDAFGGALGLTFLNPVAEAFVWIALLAWVVTFGGMLRSLTRLAAASVTHRFSGADGG